MNTEFKGGYVYALIGNNGSGKTTFIQSLLGALKYSKGNVYWGDLEFKHNSEEIKSLYAYVPDDSFFTSKVYKVVNAIADLDKRFSRERCSELLEMFEVNVDEKVNNLSKGSIKKFLFSVGLSFDCKVLVLDEPTANVDIKSKEKMLELLREFMDDDKIIIFSTHIVSEVSQIADYVMLLNKGNLIVNEDVVTLQERYKTIDGEIQTIEQIALQLLD